MYAYLKGTVSYTEPDAVILDVNDIGYRVYVPNTLLAALNVGDMITLYTYTCVREDAFILYGFESRDDLELYKMLINVSGIGPKMGISILSVMDANDVRSAIMLQDAKLLSSAPGIGSKTAGRIILELKDRIKPEDIIFADHSTGNDAHMGIRAEAYEALIGLGISPSKANTALNSVTINEDTKIETLLKQLLTKL
ncbi:MAG: Holliday junction branch migration protein RuvA [Lachnospiraceae bacterium]|nr:Holliday junction branch migration protein RuvA [Lachnospiraceae bacterium]